LICSEVSAQKTASRKTEGTRVSDWQSFGSTGSSQKKTSQSYSYAATTASSEMTGLDAETSQATICSHIVDVLLSVTWFYHALDRVPKTRQLCNYTPCSNKFLNFQFLTPATLANPLL